MDLTTLVEQGTAVNLTAAACLTILLYDHMITFDQEVLKMWPAKLSLAKILFFMNRYPVEAVLLFNCVSASRPFLSPDFCIFYLRWLTVATTLSTTVVQGILVLRVWALNRRNKWALWTAYFFYFGGTATLVGLVIKDYVGEEVLINMSLSSLPGCYATSVPSIIAGFWIGPLIVETVLFLLVIQRAFGWWKEGAAIPAILRVLARDSTMYFTIVFALLLANYLMFELGPPFLSSLLVTPSTTAGCILGSHMILNLRAMTEPTTADLGTIKTDRSTEMVFSVSTTGNGRRAEETNNSHPWRSTDRSRSRGRQGHPTEFALAEPAPAHRSSTSKWRPCSLGRGRARPQNYPTVSATSTFDQEDPWQRKNSDV